jgi:16S rRNA processing protein RimM
LGDRVVIGRVVGTFGLKGFLKIWPETDFPERFDPGNTLFVGDKPYEVVELQWHKKQARVRLKGVRRLPEAEPLIGSEVSVPTGEIPELEEGEYMVGDLLGLSVYDVEGKLLGTLDEVIPAPAHDLYRIGETLVPAVSEFVIEIDIANQRMVIRPLPGLFPEGTKAD